MEPNLATHAIEIVRHYVLRAIDEEKLLAGEENVHIQLLRDFCTDVKRSDRFVLIASARDIHEIYTSVSVNSYMRDFIHQGATYLILSLGQNQYVQLVEDLRDSLIRGYWTSIEKSSVTSEITQILNENPWLVFCILSRYAWFAETKAEK